MNARDAWLATLGQLQVQLNRATYDTWLRHAELLGYEDGRFVVTVPHAYAKDWIERHLLESMTRTLSDIFRQKSEIQVIVWDPVDEDEPSLLLTPELSPAALNLNPLYTFENFVVGQSNQYAALLARAIVENSPGKYSPVMFCGEMGMGKTHLLQAIARSLGERGHNTIYVSAEDFTTELVAAIRSQNTFALREKYRLADAVLIDDMQFVEGKTTTQNEIIAIWDTLRNRQKTMVFAADRLPVDMAKISKDMRSRLQAGPIALIDAPDMQLRRDILDVQSRRRRMRLTAEVRDLLAGAGHTSPRELEGALEQLHTYAQLTGNVLTSDIARMVLQMRGEPSRRESHSLDAVLQATAAYYHLSDRDLAGRQRTRMIALARQLAMYLAREETTASLVQIGAALGGRDHSTVMHGCTKITEMLGADAKLADDVVRIRQLLKKAPEATESLQKRKKPTVPAHRLSERAIDEMD